MRAGVLLLTEASAPAPALRAFLADFHVHEHELSRVALESDRAALSELDAALTTLRKVPELDPERVAVLGLGRGGTLAFLLGCTRRVAAVVDVDGPVLYPGLSSLRPTQPLELALNFEGAFLGLFARGGAVGTEELGHLRALLSSAARPHELVSFEGGGRPAAGEGVFDPRRAGYDARRAEELGERVRAFLQAHLAAETDADETASEQESR